MISQGVRLWAVLTTLGLICFVTEVSNTTATSSLVFVYLHLPSRPPFSNLHDYVT